MDSYVTGKIIDVRQWAEGQDKTCFDGHWVTEEALSVGCSGFSPRVPVPHVHWRNWATISVYALWEWNKTLNLLTLWNLYAFKLITLF